MPESILFIPECHIDTALARTLLRDRQRLIKHIRGAPKVANELHEQAGRHGNSRLLIGMVDRDDNLFDIPKLKPFRQVEVERCEDAGSPFTVYQHPDYTNHYLIVLGPKACDGWIHGAVQAAGMSFVEHGLAPSLEDFLLFTKKKLVEDNPLMVALLKNLRRHAPPAYTQLSDFVAARLTEAGQSNW